MFSVADEKEAQALIVLACPINNEGQYYSRELADSQTLDNLEKFSTRLDQAHEVLMRTNGCRCATT